MSKLMLGFCALLTVGCLQAQAAMFNVTGTFSGSNFSRPTDPTSIPPTSFSFLFDFNPILLPGQFNIPSTVTSFSGLTIGTSAYTAANVGAEVILNSNTNLLALRVGVGQVNVVADVADDFIAGFNLPLDLPALGDSRQGALSFLVVDNDQFGRNSGEAGTLAGAVTVSQVTQPVPQVSEPVSAALLVTGLFGLAALRRRLWRSLVPG